MGSEVDMSRRGLGCLAVLFVPGSARLQVITNRPAHNLPGGHTFFFCPVLYSLAKLGLEANRKRLRRRRAHSWPARAAPEPRYIEAGFGLGSHALDHLVGELDSAPGLPVRVLLLSHVHLLAAERHTPGASSWHG